MRRGLSLVVVFCGYFASRFWRDTTISEQVAVLRRLREMLAGYKLREAATVEATGLPPITPKSTAPQSPAPDVPAVAL